MLYIYVIFPYPAGAGSRKVQNKMHTWLRKIYLFTIGLPHRAAVSLGIASVVLASMLLPPSVAGAAISNGYQSVDDEKLVPGTLVILDDKDARTIRGSTNERKNDLLGIVVQPDSALLNLSIKETEVQVGTTGTVEAIVSTENGPIAVGDRITASRVKGVGSRAVESGRVVGIAQQGLNDTTQGTTKKEITYSDGKKTELTFGRIQVLVDVGNYTPSSAQERSALPKIFVGLADSVSGKEVATGRIYAGLVIIILALVTVTVLLYGAVRSAIISIGRNPLSRHSVQRSLIQVLGLSVFILVMAFGSVYVIFKN